jgi:hypothetical protein
MERLFYDIPSDFHVLLNLCLGEKWNIAEEEIDR